MKSRNILGDYEVIVTDDWMYDYQYEPSHPICHQQSVVNHRYIILVDNKKVNDDDDEDSNRHKIKTFYMKGRVYTPGEPISRSFRRNNYIPVDEIQEAQIIYDRVEDLSPKMYNELQPWQYISSFPNEETFFDDEFLMKNNIIDRTKPNGVICNPLLYNGLKIDGFKSLCIGLYYR